MSRRRYTQTEREHLLAAFAEADLSATDFCREHQLCYQTFGRWRKRARETNPARQPDFIEIALPEPVAPACSLDTVELHFPGGLTLRINPATNS